MILAVKRGRGRAGVRRTRSKPKNREQQSRAEHSRIKAERRPGDKSGFVVSAGRLREPFVRDCGVHPDCAGYLANV